MCMAAGVGTESGVPGCPEEDTLNAENTGHIQMRALGRTTQGGCGLCGYIVYAKVYSLISGCLFDKGIHLLQFGEYHMSELSVMDAELSKKPNETNVFRRQLFSEALVTSLARVGPSATSIEAVHEVPLEKIPGFGWDLDLLVLTLVLPSPNLVLPRLTLRFAVLSVVLQILHLVLPRLTLKLPVLYLELLILNLVLLSPTQVPSLNFVLSILV